MYGAFDGCKNIQFPDGYKAYFKFSNSLYPYFTFSEAQQAWIADRAGVFGGSDVSNINVYLNLIKSFPYFKYANKPIKVEFVTTVQGICTLELYKTESNSFAWKAVRQKRCHLSDFRNWIEENPFYGNVPVKTIDKNIDDSTIIKTEVCSLVRHRFTGVYYVYEIDEKYTTTEEIIDFFKAQDFIYTVDLGGITIKVFVDCIGLETTTSDGITLTFTHDMTGLLITPPLEAVNSQFYWTYGRDDVPEGAKIPATYMDYKVRVAR